MTGFNRLGIPDTLALPGPPAKAPDGAEPWNDDGKSYYVNPLMGVTSFYDENGDILEPLVSPKSDAPVDSVPPASKSAIEDLGDRVVSDVGDGRPTEVPGGALPWFGLRQVL